MTLGGRAAEEIIFNKVSTGALSDLERVTKMAYSIVTIYGMNEKIGNVSFYDSKQSEYNFTKPYSEETARIIDQEVSNLIIKTFKRTKDLLSEKIKELEIIARELLEKEIIFQTDLERLIGKRPFEKQTTYQAFTNGTPEVEKEAKTEEGKKTSNKKTKTKNDTPAESASVEQTELQTKAAENKK
jgi:AFG3 family protein